MTTCPVCGGLMPRRLPSVAARRQTCSPNCGNRVGIAKQRATHAQVDEAAVYRLTHGQRVASTKAERLEAVRLLRAQGRTYRQVADALRVTPKSIARYVAELKGRKETAA